MKRFYVLFFVRPALGVVDGMTCSNTRSSSPAGVSRVRVAARRPGSRLGARSGNGPGRGPASRALLGEQLSGLQHQAKPAASLVPALRAEEEEPSPGSQGEGHGKGEEPGCAAPRNLPAYGALNVQKVAAGTGEALPGPGGLRKLAVGATRPITGDSGKWVACRVGVGGGRSTA